MVLSECPKKYYAIIFLMILLFFDVRVGITGMLADFDLNWSLNTTDMIVERSDSIPAGLLNTLDTGHASPQVFSLNSDVGEGAEGDTGYLHTSVDGFGSDGDYKTYIMYWGDHDISSGGYYTKDTNRMVMYTKLPDGEFIFHLGTYSRTPGTTGSNMGRHFYHYLNLKGNNNKYWTKIIFNQHPTHEVDSKIDPGDNPCSWDYFEGLTRIYWEMKYSTWPDAWAPYTVSVDNIEFYWEDRIENTTSINSISATYFGGGEFNIDWQSFSVYEIHYETFEVRYSKAPIEDATDYANATIVPGSPSDGWGQENIGHHDNDYRANFTLPSVSTGTRYYFAVKDLYSSHPKDFTRIDYLIQNGVNSSPPPIEGLSINTDAIPDGLVGSLYTKSLSVSGGVSPYTWSLESGSLPVGLSLSSSGVLSGMPIIDGTDTFTVKVIDSDSPASTVTKEISITVTEPPALSIGTTSLIDGMVGEAYNSGFIAEGGVPPYTWSLASGSLPDGLTLSSSGVVTGVPSFSGTETFTLVVNDSDSPSNTVSREFSLLITEPPPLSIETINLPNGIVGGSYNGGFIAEGGVPPYTWSLASGSLPAGLTLSSAGSISGTAEAEETQAFVVKVTDMGTPISVVTKQFSLAVSEAPLDMVADWPMDEGSGIQVSDISGNNNDLSLINGATWTSGKFGGAIRFDGNDDYAYIADFSLNGAFPANGAADFTVTAWIKLGSLNKRHPIISKQANETRGFLFEVNDLNQLAIQVFSSNTLRTDVTSSAILQADKWYHVAATYDYVGSDNSKVRLYIDGVKDGSIDSAVGPVMDNSENLEIGRYNWSNSYQRYMEGVLDQAMIFNRALSIDEIGSLMDSEIINMPSPPSAPGELKIL